MLCALRPTIADELNDDLSTSIEGSEQLYDRIGRQALRVSSDALKKRLARRANGR